MSLQMTHDPVSNKYSVDATAPQETGGFMMPINGVMALLDPLKTPIPGLQSLVTAATLFAGGYLTGGIMNYEKGRRGEEATFGVRWFQ